MQGLIQSVSPSHGRVLIYVWAIEQDNLSKRAIPTSNGVGAEHVHGQDVFVPWVLSPQITAKTGTRGAQGDTGAEANEARGSVAPEPRTFNRYYHMFAKGELRQLVCEAATELGLCVGNGAEQSEGGTPMSVAGIEIVQDGWERSNYYVEFRRWTV